MAQTPFTEVEMMILSKLSYSRIANSNFNSDGTAKQPVELKAVLNSSAVKKDLYDEFGSKTVENFISKVSHGDYKIVKAYDDPNVTGFAAIAIEGPEKGTVTVAARGTQMGASNSMDEKIKDILTDGQLGFAAETDQQRAMDNFMKDLDTYDSIYLTGHSLGGNLAESGAVGFEDSDKIKQVYTFNAPGQNKAYRDKNFFQIQKVKGKIKNYKNEGDLVSDINESLGEEIVIQSKTGDSFDATSGFVNHNLGDMEYKGDQFVRKEGGKKTWTHRWTTSKISEITGILSYIYKKAPGSKIFDLVSHKMLDKITPVVSRQTTNVTYGSSDYVYVSPSGLRTEAKKLRMYQKDYVDIVQKMTTLMTSLQEEHIWDAPATDVFVENYQNLQTLYEQFGNIITEYATIMEGVANRMEQTDDTFSRKFHAFSIK